ncbi:short-chain specific acyl-CoA dehydrogenase, mitochondrial-like [Culicoides brevitarsis]|uniref:short-chain specific acyl-CoA dehydrogenase, mitochondrial-like n=1 Tax=Culicoides brevitarsis TaxID=469753 RepID=UPI00307C4A87
MFGLCRRRVLLQQRQHAITELQRRNVQTVYELTGRHKEIQELCRKFAKTELKPVAAANDRDSRYPEQQVKRLFELGLMGICASPDFGGLGLDSLAFSVAIEELSRGCSSTAVVCSIHNALCVGLLEKCGTLEQKNQFLKEFTTNSVGFFALSETEAGSDVVALSTEAKNKDESFILNGKKAWVTSAPEAKAGIVLATVDKELGHSGITAFIIEKSFAGVKIGPKIDKLGLRASSTSDLYLKDVKVPQKNLIGSVGEGFKLAMNQLELARIGKASVAVGIASEALKTAILYASERRQFNQRLLTMPTVKIRLAEMSAKLEAARVITRTAAIQRDTNGKSTKLSSMAKFVACEAATEVAHCCIQIMGAMGIVGTENAERLYRDARVTQILGGVTDIQKLVVADQLIREYRLDRKIGKGL